MNAIILAAGVGRRLGPAHDQRPKCLLQVGQRSLIARHLSLLEGRINHLDCVVGFKAEVVEEAIQAWRAAHSPSLSIDLITNQDFERGSILSLAHGLKHAGPGDLLVMDADVLYDHRLLDRLLNAPEATCLLVDEDASLKDEEMVIGVASGRARVLARARDLGDLTIWERRGEGVGFLKVGGADRAALLTCVNEVIEEGRVLADYEEGVARFLAHVHCGACSVAGIPWLEIDFQDDLLRAERHILPLLI